MAGLTRSARSGVWSLCFRLHGKQYCRSLKTRKFSEAERLKAQIEDLLLDLDKGKVQIPVQQRQDPWPWLFSLGRMEAPSSSCPTLQDLIRAYETLQTLNKATNTCKTEKIHHRHLLRILSGNKPLDQLDRKSLQAYILHRVGQGIQAVTIQKELMTLQGLLSRAEGLLSVSKLNPAALFKGLEYPRTQEQEPFRSWKEIEHLLASQGETANLRHPAWASLYLTIEEVQAFLADMDKLTRSPKHHADRFVFMTLLMAAHTGMRRSEIFASLRTDWDLDRKLLFVREKKKRQGRDTFRTVDLTETLIQEVQSYWHSLSVLKISTTWAVVSRTGKPLNSNSAVKGFYRLVRRHPKWKVLHGFHVLRHSFASNLARAGVDPRTIDSLMGHQTEEMRRRYSHLFPEARRAAVDLLFGE